MSGVTYFYESCPVCGRHLRIPVKHYGRLMECSHCGGELQAGRPAGELAGVLDVVEDAVRRH